MGKTGALVLALALSGCGSSPQQAAPPTGAPATPRPTTVAESTPYPPTPDGFAGKVLIERGRNLGASFSGVVWITPTSPDALGVSAAISDAEAFSAFYQSAAERSTTANVLYVTPDLPPLPAGNYTESLRYVTIQPAGRSSAHKHPGIEAVLVLEGRILVRSGLGPPAVFTKGQGFYMIPNVPVQVINLASTQSRNLVYGIIPAGLPFSTDIGESP